MTAKRLTLPALLLAASLGAVAQELNSEFTVDHIIVPEERAATRLPLIPAIDLPALKSSRLTPTSLLHAGSLLPTMTGLEPAPWLTSIATSPWRGYAEVAFGPLYNLDASAGYRLIDRANLGLDAFMQFNGFSYSSKHPDKAYRVYGPQHLHRNTAVAGLRSAWAPLRGATLTAAADYSFTAMNIPMPIISMADGVVRPNTADPKIARNFVNNNSVNISADWRHAVSRKFSYNVSAAYGLAAFSRFTDAATENRGALGLTLNYDHGSKSHWLLDLNSQLLAYDGHGHKGVLSVRPAYTLTLSHFTMRLGVKVDFRLGNIANPDINADGWIYPDFLLSWKPSAHFTLWGKADGRTDVNSLASLFESQPYNYPLFDGLEYYSRIYNLDLGMTLGPWSGAAITVFGGVSGASDWLVPAVKTGYWDARNVGGAHFGASAEYAFRRYIAFNARWEMATAPADDFNTGYYLWRDHARMDVNLSATSRPIDPLSVRVAWHLRTDRAKPMPGFERQNLGNISDFDLSASYDLTPQWSVSLRGENLFNHIYYLGPAIPAQGIRVMAGASYKF